MNYELVIDASKSTEVVIALLRDKQLIELHREKNNKDFAVGDIYLGKIKKIMPSLNAVFVDVGYERDAFLHYLDLGPQVQSLVKFMKLTQQNKINHSSLQHFKLEPEIIKTGKITQVINNLAMLPVQIAKEPISNKGPRISTELSLAGRYVVLVPFSDRVSVSQKIKTNEERDRLRKMTQEVKPKGFGVIVRTVAEGKTGTEIETDLKELVARWEKMFQEIKTATPPTLLVGEINKKLTILRDVLNDTFQAIHVNSPEIAEEIETYLKEKSTGLEGIVKLYKGKSPIFDQFGIDRQIKAAFGKTVTFKSGGYLILEHTEAMHVIDVNSGNRSTESTQEGNALETNLEAAREIARQLRLRDMGGIIVVDFIDMHNPEHKNQLFQVLKDEMKHDKAKHNILPPSKFGLMQITRQRVRPETNIKVLEKCPTCNGSGEIGPSILVTDEIENNLRFILKEQNEKKVSLAVHPFVAAYLKEGFPSVRFNWWRKYGKWVKVEGVSSLNFLEYQFYNGDGEEIAI